MVAISGRLEGVTWKMGGAYDSQTDSDTHSALHIRFNKSAEMEVLQKINMDVMYKTRARFIFRIAND